MMEHFANDAEYQEGAAYIRRQGAEIGVSFVAETLSQSQRSWCTVWKCQRRLPVRASSASRQFANRLEPGRSAP